MSMLYSLIEGPRGVFRCISSIQLHVKGSSSDRDSILRMNIGFQWCHGGCQPFGSELASCLVYTPNMIRLRSQPLLVVVGQFSFLLSILQKFPMVFHAYLFLDETFGLTKDIRHHTMQGLPDFLGDYYYFLVLQDTFRHALDL